MPSSWISEPTYRVLNGGEKIFELKREKTYKAAAYECLEEEVLGEGIEMRAQMAEATPKVKKPRRDHERRKTVRLRNGPVGTQLTLVKLSVAGANKSVKVDKLQDGNWIADGPTVLYDD